MTVLFEYPKKAYFGRIVPKSKFYEHASISAKQKELFVKQVEQITWEYKLAPETLNLNATNDVPELQIFKIVLKANEYSNDLLRLIDQAVKYPLIFEIYSENGIIVSAAYKRRSEANSDQWVLGSYYHSDLLPLRTNREPLEYSLNLSSVYEQILKALLPLKGRHNEMIDELIIRNDLFQKKTLELRKIEKKLDVEKQFNKKVELNSTLKNLMRDIEQIAA